MKKYFPVLVCAKLSVAAALGAHGAHADNNHPTIGNDTLYITHVTVVDTATGDYLRDQTVVISDGRIERLTPSSRTTPPYDGRAINGAGRYLIPGLWDMHVHVWAHPSSYAVIVANGVTGVRDMSGPPDASKFRAELASSNVIAPHIYLGTPLLDGPPLSWTVQTIEVKSPVEGRDVVNQQFRRGVDFIKVYGGLSHDSYVAIAEESRRLRIPFAGHAPISVSAEEASRARQKSIEHLTGVALACSSQEDELRTKQAASTSWAASLQIESAIIASYSKRKCARLAETFKENDTWLVPTLVVWRSYAKSTDEAFMHDARLQYFGGALGDTIRGNLQLQSDPIDKNKRPIAGDELFESNQRLVGSMMHAGVSLLAGTDSGGFMALPGFSLHDELELLVKSGVSPLGALQASTRNAALFMGAGDKYGSVEAGKMADLVLLDADPLQDIRNTTKIYTVILGGRVFDRTALDKILRDAAAAATVSSKEFRDVGIPISTGPDAL